MFKRFAATAAALLVMAIGAVALASPANAAASECPAGKYCVWISGDLPGGPNYYWTVPGGSGGYCINYGPGLNDKVGGNALKGGRSATQYRDANCTGNTVSFIYAQAYGSPWWGSCSSSPAWACTWEGAGSYLPSSVWIMKS